MYDVTTTVLLSFVLWLQAGIIVRAPIYTTINNQNHSDLEQQPDKLGDDTSFIKRLEIKSAAASPTALAAAEDLVPAAFPLFETISFHKLQEFGSSSQNYGQWSPLFLISLSQPCAQ